MVSDPFIARGRRPREREKTSGRRGNARRHHRRPPRRMPSSRAAVGAPEMARECRRIAPVRLASRPAPRHARKMTGRWCVPLSRRKSRLTFAIAGAFIIAPGASGLSTGRGINLPDRHPRRLRGAVCPRVESRGRGGKRGGERGRKGGVTHCEFFFWQNGISWNRWLRGISAFIRAASRH